MKELLEELRFCIDMWDKQGYCEFGGHTKCKDCAAPYLLFKIINGKLIHRKMTLEEWKKKLD